MRLKHFLAAAAFCLTATTGNALAIEGTVLSANKPLAGASVTLWVAQETGRATAIAEVTSEKDGTFTFDAKTPSDQWVYITAASGPVGQILILGADRPEKVVLNELGTIASAFTGAQFLDGTNFSGHELGLRIAAGNVKNFVDPATGEWGKVLVDGNNSSRSTTLARFNTMGNLLALCGMPEQDKSCDALLSQDKSGLKNTLGVIQSIAKQPWANANELFELFAKSYVAPKTANPQERRAGVTYVPYLSYTPDDFSLSLKFTGGGIYSAGRIAFDANGNMWSGQNWMPGSQSGAINGIGGGLAAMTPDGTPISPPITGFTGMGIDGVGWGTGVDNDKVWLTSFNSTIGVFDFNGKPLGPEEGITLGGKFGQGQGVGIAANGDVWVADSTKDQLVHFPGGDFTKGEIVKVAGLLAPFDIAIDVDNRVWVTNSRGNNVTVFRADKPESAIQIEVGIGVRGVAHDSKGNAWVASNMTPGFQPPAFPPGEISIMKEFEVAYRNLAVNARHLPTGTVHFIPMDGNNKAQLMQKGTMGKPLNVPWGVAVDSRDNVWVGNFLGMGLLHLCGADTQNCPEGKKTGDLIHYYTNGNVQLSTAATIDPAGNIWYANNWNVADAVADIGPDRRNSTKAGGDGIVVYYGIAAPVKTPLMGPARKP